MFQKMFNVSVEERDDIIRVLAEDESEAVGSMGDDTPMPVHVEARPDRLFDYFRQQFAQVTNPPIDSLRESIVMSLQTQIGPECNIFVPAARSMPSRSYCLRRCCRSASCGRSSRWPTRACRTSSSICSATRACRSRERRCSRLCDQGREPRSATARSCCSCPTAIPRRGQGPGARAARDGRRASSAGACTGLRCKCNILVETGTARDAHHFACLIGYGATAVYPVSRLSDACST